jgi:hypothetical protein
MERVSGVGKKFLISRYPVEGDAVMFDIDDTLIKAATLTPINPIISLYYTSQALGYRTVIITARPGFKENIARTKEQLGELGIVPDYLIFTDAEKKTIAKERTGLNYILSVGDQHTDLKGSEKWIKLPDFFDKNIYTNISTQ